MFINYKINKTMGKFLKVYFNRITLVFGIGTAFIFAMLFCNPYINVVLLIVGVGILLCGSAYVIEGMKKTAGERLFLQKYFRFIDEKLS